MKGWEMKYKGRTVKNLLMLLCAATALTGCRKDLCYNHDEHALTVKANIDPSWLQEWERPYDYNKNGEYDWDWEQIWDEQQWPRSYDEFRPEVPDGLRTTVYTEDGQVIAHNMEEDGGIVSMPEGKHSLLLYNNDTEYIIFDGTDNTATATASTRTRTRSTYQAAPGHENERTITPPDMLYASYVPEYVGQEAIEADHLPVTMFPRTYSYLVRYRFSSGLNYVAQAKGSLTGMADKVFLHDGHTDATASTVLFDCKIDQTGCTAEVVTFGVPSFAYKQNEYTADPELLDFTLTLEVVLKNGKYLSFEHNVSDILRAQPRGGVILFEDIVVDDKDGQAGSGGFDPEVGDWEDEIIELPLN